MNSTVSINPKLQRIYSSYTSSSVLVPELVATPYETAVVLVTSFSQFVFKPTQAVLQNTFAKRYFFVFATYRTKPLSEQNDFCIVFERRLL
jgi:hypothetical protein